MHPTSATARSGIACSVKNEHLNPCAKHNGKTRPEQPMTRDSVTGHPSVLPEGSSLRPGRCVASHSFQEFVSGLRIAGSPALGEIAAQIGQRIDMGLRFGAFAEDGHVN